MNISNEQRKLLSIAHYGGSDLDARNLILSITEGGRKPEALKFTDEERSFDVDGGTPLTIAVKNNNLGICKLLLEYSPRDIMYFPDELGFTPLTVAFAARDISKIKFLVENTDKKSIDMAIIRMQIFGDAHNAGFLRWEDGVTTLRNTYSSKYNSNIPDPLLNPTEDIVFSRTIGYFNNEYERIIDAIENLPVDSDLQRACFDLMKTDKKIERDFKKIIASNNYLYNTLDSKLKKTVHISGIVTSVILSASCLFYGIKACKEVRGGFFNFNLSGSAILKNIAINKLTQLGCIMSCAAGMTLSSTAHIRNPLDLNVESKENAKSIIWDSFKSITQERIITREINTLNVIGQAGKSLCRKAYSFMQDFE